MKHLLTLLAVVLLGACAHVPAEPAGSAPIRAMTFNIRLDVASDGANAWPHRKEMVAAVIRREGPDLLGMQEVLLHQKQYLEAALPEYTFVGVGRDDGAQAGEFSPLGWRNDRFTAVDSGTFWLSPTPEVAGSKGWDAALPRIATWAVLRDLRSGETIRVLNTHFDHVGMAARANAARMIVQWVAAGSAPAIVMGDFNVKPGAEPYRILADTARSGLADSRSISSPPPYGPPGTFTGFDITAAADGPIDHIFATSEFAVTGHSVVTQHWEGRLPSDHYPVIADLALEAE
ncbi:endonuclease/exonuclease/phosphatase family protein [Pelagerythrobacter rhizovicinus]|uniref:Endonuclease/exonuclease/phosphatase family protein n=1 Tax=Pelagerythrobacter rhizovicinus TaxID=2268576 RepID=A0A4Q2KLG0_9SPHN|nr:endonuclease/exonuclease/phosphatase family protein [Pelagerythrobacter rhizovicinus]RXZ64173.1 endonuclease/exonuclease/phosphatase family protein [Pelagerythrobacter rhizovicinus]